MLIIALPVLLIASADSLAECSLVLLVNSHFLIILRLFSSSSFSLISFSFDMVVTSREFSLEGSDGGGGGLAYNVNCFWLMTLTVHSPP